MLAPPPLLREKLLEVDAAEEHWPPHLVPAVFEDLLFSLPPPVLSDDAQAVKLLHTGSTSFPAGEIVGDWMLQKSTWYPS